MLNLKKQNKGYNPNRINCNNGCPLSTTIKCTYFIQLKKYNIDYIPI